MYVGLRSKSSLDVLPVSWRENTWTLLSAKTLSFFGGILWRTLISSKTCQPWAQNKSPFSPFLELPRKKREMQQHDKIPFCHDGSGSDHYHRRNGLNSSVETASFGEESRSKFGLSLYEVSVFSIVIVSHSLFGYWHEFQSVTWQTRHSKLRHFLNCWQQLVTFSSFFSCANLVRGTLAVLSQCSQFQDDPIKVTEWSRKC